MALRVKKARASLLSTWVSYFQKMMGKLLVEQFLSAEGSPYKRFKLL